MAADVKVWVSETKDYFNDLKLEMRRVTWPGRPYLISLWAWCFRQYGQNFLNSSRSVVVFLFFVRE